MVDRFLREVKRMHQLRQDINEMTPEEADDDAAEDWLFAARDAQLPPPDLSSPSFKGGRWREVLQTTNSSRHVVDGAGSMLVSTVGRGLFINLNFEPSIRGNPCRIIVDLLLQRRINIGGQVRAVRMWSMEPKKNSRIVDRSACARNRS